VFVRAYPVRKYAYRMKQNVFNRFHILIKNIVGVIYIMLLSLVPIEETGETRFMTAFKFR